MSEKNEALATFLGVELDDIEQATYDENIFEYGGQEYLVLSDSEADEKAEEYIRNSLWAFNTSFILHHSKIEDINSRVENAFQKMQQELCEDANEIVFAVIEDFDDFVQDAIDSDGRGHFLAQYDNEENEIQLSGEWFYIYRTN